MKVIAGTARGTKLKSPQGDSVRPTAGLVREALFNIIGQKVIGAHFVDLYAGSGAVGIEALSRGAKLAVFIENNRSSQKLIEDNLARTRFLERARIIKTDVMGGLSFLAVESFQAELIYLDPPYAGSYITPTLKSILEKGLLTENGLIIVEHSCSNRECQDNYPGVREKRYGKRCLSIISPMSLQQL